MNNSPKFTDEQKLEYLAQIERGEYSQSGLAKEIGVTRGTVSNWVVKKEEIKARLEFQKKRVPVALTPQDSAKLIPWYEEQIAWVDKYIAEHVDPILAEATTSLGLKLSRLSTASGVLTELKSKQLAWHKELIMCHMKQAELLAANGEDVDAEVFDRQKALQRVAETIAIKLVNTDNDNNNQP